MIPFSKVTFVDDDNTVAIDANNLNNIEEALETICDGGINSGLDADTVRGKILTNPLNLKKDLILHLSGGNNLKEYPDELSPVYFQTEWRTTHSWNSAGANLSVANNHLILTPNATTELDLYRTLSGFQSKTLKIKIKNDGNLADIGAVQYLNGSSSYESLKLQKNNDYWIGTIETDSVLNPILTLKINIKPAYLSTPVRIQWIYVGSGAYDFKKISNSVDYPLSFYGVTPISGEACFKDLYFDGINDKLVSPIPSNLASEFSIVMSAKLLNNQGLKNILRMGSGENGINIFSTSGSSSFNLTFYREGNSENLTSLFSLGLTNKQIIFTYKNPTKVWKLYIDGVLESEGELANTPLMPQGSLTIGSSDTGANFTEFSLGHLFVFAKALTPEEAWELYQKPHSIEEETLTLRIDNKAPETTNSLGQVGEIRFDSSFLYVCIAPNTWKRASLTTWA